MEALGPTCSEVVIMEPLHDAVSSRQHMVMELAKNGVGIREGQQRQGKNNHGAFHWMMWNITPRCRGRPLPSRPTGILKPNSFRNLTSFRVILGSPRDTNLSYIWREDATGPPSAVPDFLPFSHNLILSSNDPITRLLFTTLLA